MTEDFNSIAGGPHFTDATGLNYRFVGLLCHRKPHTRYFARLQNMEDLKHTLVVSLEELCKNLSSTCGLTPERIPEFFLRLTDKAHQQEAIISANLPKPSQMGITRPTNLPRSNITTLAPGREFFHREHDWSCVIAALHRDRVNYLHKFGCGHCSRRSFVRTWPWVMPNTMQPPVIWYEDAD
jgi:hypothetical protein